MIFGKKKKQGRKCVECGGKSAGGYSFCPYCGSPFGDVEDASEFGLLGKDDRIDYQEGLPMAPGMGLMDKMLTSMVNNMLKNLDKQMRQNGNERAEVKAFPNGIRIKISGPYDQAPKKKAPATPRRSIDDSQIKRMSALPRATAKSQMKRLGDKVMYELSMPGVSSADDVFVSKLENGYEIKAIGDKKVYINSVPINLPLKRFSIMNNKLLVEFMANEEVFQE